MGLRQGTVKRWKADVGGRGGALHAMRSGSSLWKDEAALASSEGNVNGEVGWIVTALSGVRDGVDPRWAADRIVTIHVFGNHADFDVDERQVGQ